VARSTSSPRQSLLERWAHFQYRRRWWVLGTWLAIVVALITLQANFGGQFISEFKNPGAESQRALDLLEDRFPARAGEDADLVFRSSVGFEDAAVRAEIEQLLAAIDEIPGVSGVESPYDFPHFFAPNGTIARAVVHWDSPGFEVKHDEFVQFIELVDAASAANENLYVEAGGGVVWSNEEMHFGSEVFGLIFAMLILLIAFGSVIAMGLPLGAALFGLAAGFSILALGTNYWSIPDFSPQFAAMIGIGVGIDYSLLVVTRFREGLHHDRTVEQAVVLAVTTAGKSVIFAGIVVAISFLGLFVVGLPFVAALGAAGAVVVLCSVLVAITIMPAALSVVGHRIDRLRVPFLHSTEGVDPNSGWYRLSKQIQKRPLPYMVGATALLLFLATPLLDIELGFTDAGNGSEELRSRRAYDMLAEGFGPGFNGPLIIVADFAEEPDAATRERQADEAAAAIRNANNIVEVGAPVFNPAGDTALIIAIPGTSPQDKATMSLVHELRDDVFRAVDRGTNFELLATGGVAGTIDAQDRIEQRMPFLFAGVIGLSFLLLMVVFRSVVVAIKAAILNLLSIGAAYGVIVAVFQWGWGASILGVEPGPIETFLPMMMFAILFGLSMDYEVFLISRIREEYLMHGDNATAVSHGLAATARVITAAAAIMVAVFGAFVLGPDRVIKQFGIGLATAIFVDATVVRLLLVPSTMELLGKANWWLPGWLDRILPNVNLEGPTDPVAAPVTAAGAK
jgi:putative drug exporter of the RND superfamily